MLCIWRDKKEGEGVYYELLKPGETVTGEYYTLQLICLAEENPRKKDLILHMGGDIISVCNIIIWQCQGTYKFYGLSNHKWTAMENFTTPGTLTRHCTMKLLFFFSSLHNKTVISDCKWCVKISKFIILKDQVFFFLPWNLSTVWAIAKDSRS